MRKKSIHYKNHEKLYVVLSKTGNVIIKNITKQQAINHILKLLSPVNIHISTSLNTARYSLSCEFQNKTLNYYASTMGDLNEKIFKGISRDTNFHFTIKNVYDWLNSFIDKAKANSGREYDKFFGRYIDELLELDQIVRNKTPKSLSLPFRLPNLLCMKDKQYS